MWTDKTKSTKQSRSSFASFPPAIFWVLTFHFYPFFQFEDVSLNSCLWLLERAQLATGARANPLRVTRCISAMVKSLLIVVLLTVIIVVDIGSSTHESGRSHYKLSLSLHRQHHGTNSLPGSHLYPPPECPSTWGGKKTESRTRLHHATLR